MELTEEEVLQILKILDESDFDQLHLEVGDLKLSVSKSGPLGCMPEQPSLAVPLAEAVSARSESSMPAPAPAASGAGVVAAKPAAACEVVAEEGLARITAPMLGVFYSRPDPAAPPYVEEGQLVKEDDTVGLIEVMKLFTSVKAGVQGTVARICVESGQLVEYGQTLFLVKAQGT